MDITCTSIIQVALPFYVAWRDSFSVYFHSLFVTLLSALVLDTGPANFSLGEVRHTKKGGSFVVVHR